VHVYGNSAGWLTDNYIAGQAAAGSPLVVGTVTCSKPGTDFRRNNYIWYEAATTGALTLSIYQNFNLIPVDSSSGSSTRSYESRTAPEEISSAKLSPCGISSATPMAAVVWAPTTTMPDLTYKALDLDMQLYWQDGSGALREARIRNAVWTTDATVRAPVVEYQAAGGVGVYPTSLAAVLMPDGKRVRLFYQGVYDRVCEMRNDGAGWLDMGPIISV
jgi:hypothetical protein